MSVTQYTLPCSYRIPKLRDNVYFISKSVMKVINIDNGAADVTINNPNVIRLKGFDIRLNESESLDERYIFTKTLNISIIGHLTNSSFLMDDDYFLAVEDYNGVYYLINVDFPSKMTYTYTLNEGQNQTEFTFTSNSNFPLLKLNWSISKFTDCDTYFTSGVKSISLIEKGWARVDVEQDVITLFDGHIFKNVDFNEGSCTLTESYDGDKITNTISFDIPLGNTQFSWQYNLLEFKKNLYIAEIFPKSSSNALIIGYENGLQPSYNVTGSTSNGDSSKITITLEETSQRGLEELINWSVVENTNKKWVYIKEIDHKNAFTCIGHGLARYDYMAEVDQDGNELGNYKRFINADASNFPYLNVVGTFDDEVTFHSSVCNCSDEYVYKFNEHYYCVNGDKVQALESIHTYDCGKSGTINGTGSPLSDYTELGDVVESDSDFCEDEVEYMWVLKTDKTECIDQFVRWIPSGTTCINGDKYQNNYKQVSDDHIHWRDSDPLEWSASTVIEYDSEDCIIYRWTPSGYTCVGYDKYRNNIKEISVDGGQTWTVVIPEEYSASTLIETDSEYCGYMPPFKIKLDYSYFSNFDSYTVACNSSSTITQKDVRVENRSFVRISGVTIGSCATSIGSDAFDYCVRLKQLVIPSNITSIGEYFISDCTGLTYIIFEGTVPPTAAYGAFETEYSFNCPIYVPCESLETYKNAPEYRKVANRIQCIPPKYTIGLNGGVTSSGNCNGNDTIYGQGYEYNNPQDVLSLETGLCVKNISDSAFKNCNNMTALTLSETVENIGENAFENINVNYLEIPRCVKTIHSKAFNNSNIQTIKCFALVPPTLYEDDGDVFNYNNIQTVYVYIGQIDAYKAAPGWSKFGEKFARI